MSKYKCPECESYFIEYISEETIKCNKCGSQWVITDNGEDLLL